MLRGTGRCIGLVVVSQSRLADNGIGDEGAGRLAEPLGKLTALQELDLSGTV